MKPPEPYKNMKSVTQYHFKESSKLTVVHKDTLLPIITASSSHHLKTDILKTCSLSNLPMNTSTSGHRNSSEINNKVADLAKEVILVGVPIISIIIIGI